MLSYTFVTLVIITNNIRMTAVHITRVHKCCMNAALIAKMFEYITLEGVHYPSS
jgi:hypothetical protein